MTVFETIEVHAAEVACDGKNGGAGHPRVYLHIDRNSNQITCPYCSRTYVLKTESHASE
ncbi:MAG TPA: zinc-finger domain-containing protein [Rickettsiales bacterium]|nr:zinc-finger domain-containing protein [Rickettsiales bacterium]